jgi:hypothetical protein
VIECGSLEFAQARLQCRHGQRASEAAWQQLETTRAFAALLDDARRSPLRSWVVGITSPGKADQIEAVLRNHWRHAVAEVAGWMPTAWQPALAWCSVLADLPALQHLARRGEVLAWMHDDPKLRALCAESPQRRLAVAAAGPYRPLAAVWAQPHLMGFAWRAEWERQLPQPLSGPDDSLAQVAATLAAHGAAFAAAAPGPGGLLRRALQTRLSLLLRRAALEPAAAFIHVALCALDLERLRGELLARVLFPHPRVA